MSKLAIAYAMKKKAKKMAKGGEADEASDAPYLPGADSAQGSMRKAFKFAKGGPAPSPTPDPDYDDEDMSEEEKKHAVEAAMMAPMAMGGEMKSGYHAMPEEHEEDNYMADMEDDKSLNQHMVDMHASTSKAEQDLVDRIMMKRSKDYASEARYSKGGQVANQEHGENNNKLAGFSPNEFDDLVLRDDLESSYNGSNAGDHLGNAQEDADRKDIVARIMASRRKKDKLPNPR